MSEPVWIDKDLGKVTPTDEQIQTAANTYLEQVITNPDSPPLDRSLTSSSSATPADITGDLKSATIIYRNNLTNTDNLNTVLNPGVYRWANTANLPTNAPENTGNGILFVYNAGKVSSTTYYAQYVLQNSHVYYRNVSSASIGEWKRVANDTDVTALSDVTIQYRSNLSSTDNLNSILNPGVYRWANTSNLPTNAPENKNGGILLVFYAGQVSSTLFYLQYVVQNSHLYYRNINSSSVGDWVKVALESDVNNVRDVIRELPINEEYYNSVTSISAFTVDKYFDSQGNEIAGEGNYASTEMLPCYGFRAVAFQLYKYKSSSLTIAHLTFFDKNKQYIGNILPVGADGTGVVVDFGAIPDGAAYFVASTRTTQESPYVTFYRDSINVDLTNKLQSSTTLYKWDGTTTAAQNWYTSAFIYVKGFKSISFLGGGYHSGSSMILETLTFFDESGTRVGGVLTNISSNNNRDGKATVKIPSTAYYLKLLNHTAMTDTPYIILRNPEKDPIGVMCIGDSITEGYLGSNVVVGNPYPKIMQNILGTDYAIFNAGVGGTNASSYWESYKKYLNTSDTNVFIIMFGLNGGMGNTFETDVDPYDNYEDYADTITGCTCKLIEWLQEQKPDALIVFATPTYAGVDTNNETQAKRQIANMPELQSRYNMSVIDIRNHMGVNEKNLSYWMATDKVHGKDQHFYEKLGMLFANQIKTILNLPD